MSEQQILEEVRETNKKLDGMRKTLFGDDGQGGIVHTLHDLQSTVCGINSSQDDRGLVGDVKDIKTVLNGTHSRPGIIGILGKLDSELRDVKDKQSIWNKSLTGGQLIAWIGLAWKLFKG